MIRSIKFEGRTSVGRAEKKVSKKRSPVEGGEKEGGKCPMIGGQLCRLRSAEKNGFTIQSSFRGDQ